MPDSRRPGGTPDRRPGGTPDHAAARAGRSTVPRPRCLVAGHPARSQADWGAAWGDLLLLADCIRRTCLRQRAFLGWCALRDLDPVVAARHDREPYVQWLQETRGFKPSTVFRRTSVIAGLYRTLRHRRCAAAFTGGPRPVDHRAPGVTDPGPHPICGRGPAGRRPPPAPGRSSPHRRRGRPTCLASGRAGCPADSRHGRLAP